jgi:prepilin-type N-terminal cleavage/methylation domain-containing protein
MTPARAFTLVETMLAVLLLALLASAAAMTFSRPIAQARGEEALDLLRHFDATTRAAAVAGSRTMRITFDLSNGTLSRRDPRAAADDVRYAAKLPPGCRIVAFRIGGESTTSGEAPLDVSAGGLSRTYAVHLVSPAADHWVAFAGFSGEAIRVSDESKLSDILDARP